MALARRLDRGRFGRVARIGAVGVALGLLAVLLWVYFARGFVPGDAYVYLAAGERLNAGHPLYALSPGDRVVELKPPYWTVPLLSPPPIAVLWRPLAALPGELGVKLWWAATIGSIAASIGLLLARRPVLASAAVVVLSVPLTYEIGVGNVNGLLLLGTIGTWLLARSGRDRAAGVLVGLMAALKVWPIVLGWWLLVTGRRRAAGAVVAALAVAGLMSVAGAGLAAHLDYLGIARQTDLRGASDLSLAGIARALGLAAWLADALPVAWLVAGLAAAWVMRRRPGPAYAICVAVMVLGSPVVNINTYALLLAALGPAVWPLVPGQGSHAGGNGRTPAANPDRAGGMQRTTGAG